MANATNAPPKKKGKPRLTDAQIIAGLVEYDGLVHVAARALGIEASTIYRRRDKSKAIRQALADSRGMLLDVAESALKAGCLQGEGWAVCFTLKSLGQSRGYGERLNVVHEFDEPGSALSELKRRLAGLAVPTGAGQAPESADGSGGVEPAV